MHALSRRLGGLSAALPFLIACGGDKPSGEAQGSGGSGAQAGASGAGGAGSGGLLGAAGGTTSTGGSGGSGGAPLRPPNPRTDIGPPDGVHCQGDVGAAVECGVGQQCCQAGIADTVNECVAPNTVCQTCKSPDCGAVLCDGPEDCPGRLCCYTQTTCARAGAPCGTSYGTAQCEDSCQDYRRDQLVVCRDDRDCLRPSERCTRRTSLPDVSTCI